MIFDLHLAQMIEGNEDYFSLPVVPITTTTAAAAAASVSSITQGTVNDPFIHSVPTGVTSPIIHMNLNAHTTQSYGRVLDSDTNASAQTGTLFVYRMIHEK
jgi:hypothetical protein